MTESQRVEVMVEMQTALSLLVKYKCMGQIQANVTFIKISKSLHNNNDVIISGNGCK